MRQLEERRRFAAGVALITAVCALSACGGTSPGAHDSAGHADPAADSPHASHPAADPSGGGARENRGTPQVDVYAYDRPGMLSPVVAKFPSRVYVPNSESDTVSVIDPRTYRVIRVFPVHGRPQHVVPSWDLKTLWVNNNDGNTLIPIDPVTGMPGKAVPVDDPYNLYFTLDGRTALVMAERNNRLDFRDPHTMRLRHSMNMPCRGINHGDFTADGAVFLASCEFSGQLVAIDVGARKVLRVITLTGRDVPRGIAQRTEVKGGAAPPGGVSHVPGGEAAHGAPAPPGAPPGAAEGAVNGAAEGAARGTSSQTAREAAHSMAGHSSMPQDVKLSPDGTTFYVADMARDGVWLVDAVRFRVTGFIKTGAGAHGLYVSRDSRLLYVSNRGAGSVSVVSFARGRPVDTWRIPGGGSPDMGGVSADGRRLWLSGRYNGVVYVFDTESGRLLRKIPVGAGPHGLAVYPQPGRYSLGHTGVFR
ncbi:YncE family protein [Streptosporangium sp. NPDC051022]|uniref:YncE family protein n=1 Tax=Streptosporangium sp. NPDC051022 TaxID=3155752 RepID=UPI0034429C6C